MNKIYKKSLRNAIGIGIGIGIEHFNAIMTGGFLSKRVSTWGDSPAITPLINGPPNEGHL